MIRRAIRLGPLLATFWLLLSGHFTTLLLALGLLSVVLVVWITHRMATSDGVSVRARPSPRMPLYAGWLLWEVLLSSLAVLRQVWARRPEPRPVVGTTPVDGLSEGATVAYANSITLTPGTLSLQVEDGGIEVHALDQSGLDELRTGGMHDRLRRLGGR